MVYAAHSSKLWRSLTVYTRRFDGTLTQRTDCYPYGGTCRPNVTTTELAAVVARHLNMDRGDIVFTDPDDNR